MKIRVVRPMFFRGEAVAEGTMLTVTPLEAAAAIDSTRAELVDPADADQVQAAVAEDANRTGHELNKAAEQQAATWMLRVRQRA